MITLVQHVPCVTLAHFNAILAHGNAITLTSHQRFRGIHYLFGSVINVKSIGHTTIERSILTQLYTYITHYIHIMNFRLNLYDMPA